MDNQTNQVHQVETKEAKNSNKCKSLFDILDTIVTVSVLLAIVIAFAFRMADVDGVSMMDTLLDRDKLVVSQIFYNPKPGDVVVISRGQLLNHPIVKRVIACEGDTLEIDYTSAQVKVNGVVIDEPYIKSPTTQDENGVIPKVIPKGYVFVMGDNRGNSTDSRSNEVGLIDKNNILGKVIWRLWGKGYDVSRFGGVR